MFLAIKTILFFLIIFWMLWKKYCTGKNVFSIVAVPLVTVCIEMALQVMCYDFFIIPLFLIIRKFQKLPLLTRDSLFTLLAISCAEAIALSTIILLGSLTSGDF